MGDMPSILNVLPGRRGWHRGNEIANISDHKPMVHVHPFGLCHSLANPVVATATALNGGILKPMPCIPNTLSPWLGSKPNIKIDHIPVLLTNCKLMCMWAGTIEIIDENNKLLYCID
jgi:hypothetical protein